MKAKYSKTTIRQAQDALTILFPSCKFTVAPNGQDEIWVKDAAGYGFSIRMSAAKAGIGVTLRKFAGASPLTATGNQHKTEAPIAQVDATEVSVTVYRNDEYSQQFKRWYSADSAGRATDATFRHPDEMGIIPPAGF